MRTQFLFAAAVFGLALVTSATAENVKVISSLPRTGSANAQSTSIVNGIRLAIEEAGGKSGSLNISYEDWDDASPERGSWDPAVEAANADKAIKDSEIVAYIGTYNSGAAKIAMPKLNEAGLLMISPGATWPGLTKPGVGEPNEPAIYRPSGAVRFFRVVPADDIQGLVAAKWAAQLGLKKVFVLHDRELYGKGVAEMFKRASDGAGLEVVGFEGIDLKASNYKSLATKIKQKKPDLVYFGGTTQTNAGQLAKDLVNSGLNAKMMFPDGCFENAFIEAAGKDVLEGRAYITFGGVPAAQLKGKGQKFYESYKKRFNSEPEAYAAYGYEAASVVLNALKETGKDRAKLIEAVSKTKDYDGALGTWSFDANGDTTLKTMSGNAVKNGQFEFLTVLGQ